MRDVQSNEALSLQAMSQSVASMQENITLLGENIARTQFHQSALLDQLRLLGQSSENVPADSNASDAPAFVSVSGLEVNELDEQNRHIQLTLDRMRHAIQLQRRELLSLNAAMRSVEGNNSTKV
jgi:uncharacterized small protein (DUF1192 family)